MADQPHPDAQELLDLMEEHDMPPMPALSPSEAREMQREMSQPSPEYEPEPVGGVTDAVVRGRGHGIPVRVYEPRSEPTGGVLVWAHGGGFLLGDIEGSDPTGRALANASGHVVVSVDYRLAPEHRFPAALEDMIDATAWAAEHGGRFDADGSHVAVVGASAGANLAAATALYYRDHGESTIDYQVLAYPWVSFQDEFESHDEHDGLFLTREELDYFADCYLENDLHGRNPYAFPLEETDFSDLPPATVLTAGFDPLRDEGLAYRDALREHGVDVTHHHYERMIHAFLGMLAEPEWDRARDAVEDIGADLRNNST